MIAIAQSGHNYHYLNWIASEVGPIVTSYGGKVQILSLVEGVSTSDIITRILKSEGFS